MSTKRKPTPEINKGAQAERRAFYSKIYGLWNREVSEQQDYPARSTNRIKHVYAQGVIEELLQWVRDRKKRTAKAAGGIGRR